MNKKGYTLTVIIVATILAIFTFLFIYAFFMPGSDLMGKTADLGEDLASKYLKQTGEQAKAAQAGSVRGSFLNICSALKRNYTNYPCYSNYGGVPDNINDGKVVWKGDTLEMMDETGKQDDTCYVKKSPCAVVGGSTADNFVKRYYKEGDSSVSESSTFRSVSELTITEYGGMHDDPIIETSAGNGDLEDSGILFVNREGNPCFFVTKDGDPFGGCDGGSELDDDCIGKILKGEFNLPKCS